MDTYTIEINREEYKLLINALTTEWLKFEGRKKDEKNRAKIAEIDALTEKIEKAVRG